MAQKSGFFNSINNDRVYDAADVASFLTNFFTNGIFNNSLAVTSNDNMTVSVAAGSANINGYSYTNTDTLTLDITAADSTLGRIDSVIVRLNLTNRAISILVLEGDYATTPSQPSIIRVGSIYDLRLANISVPAEATRITADMITDTRFGADCGNVVQAVQHLDTSEIFSQYEIWFNNWFSNLQNQLDNNQASNLQNQIDKTNIALGLSLDNFSTSTTYAIGDRVIYDNKIYEFTSAHTGDWDSSDVSLVPMINNGIVEAGSNENGSYIRFGDGTQICWTKIVGNSFSCTTVGGNGRYYYRDVNNVENTKTWTFPKEFTDTPNINLSVSSNAYSMASIGNSFANRAVGYCVLPYPVSSTQFTWNFIAIGRWQ